MLRVAAFPFEVFDGFGDPTLDEQVEDERWAHAFDRERERFLDLAQRPEFLVALEAANPEVASRWLRAAGRPRSLRSRHRRLDAAVLHYLVRGATRPTPHGGWAGDVGVEWTTEGGPLRSEWSRAAKVEWMPDLAVFERALALLRRSERYRSGPVRWHPSMQRAEVGWVGFVDGGPRRVPPGAAVEALWQWCGAEPRPLAPLLAELGPAGAELAELLLDLGVLEAPIGFDAAGSDPWDLLDAAARTLADDHREGWHRAVAEIKVGGDAGAVLWNELALPGAPPGSGRRLVHRPQMKVVWGDGAREAAARSVAAFLRAVGSDPATEAYRARAAAGSAPARTEDCWTRPGIFEARFGVEARADAAEDRWADRLRAVRADRVHDLQVTDAESALPGPFGTVVVRLGPEGTWWAPWGRPQPGLFARHPGAVRDLEAVLAGRPVAEIVGRDLVDPNGRVRPAVAPFVVAVPSLEFSVDDRAAWLVADDGLRLPIYDTPAAIGAHDAASARAFAAAMHHGWEWASVGFPVLEAEVREWHHLPRLCLPDGVVLSPERWILGPELVARLGQLDGADRFRAWRSAIERRGIGTRVTVQWQNDPAALPLAVRTDSPLCVQALFDRLRGAAVALRLRELPTPDERIHDADGKPLAAEVAMMWTREDWWEQ